MAVQRISLSIYRIRDSIGGEDVSDFDDAVTNPDDLSRYDLTGDYDYDARLYVAPSKESIPSWVDFLEAEFGDIPEVANSVINSALLILRVKYYTDRYFAIPFGYGRYLLNREGLEPNYGLRVALNAIYQGMDENSELDPTRIRSVDSKTVTANTLYTRRQATRWATFETFDVDVDHDLLRAVTGIPVENFTWGTRITGADALNVNLSIDFADLGEFCRQIERTYRRDDYQEGFAWVDHIHTVTNRDLIGNLEEHLLDMLKKKNMANFQMAPPELIDWDEIDSFRFTFKSDVDFSDLTLSDYLDLLEDEGKLDELTIKQLRTSHKVEAVNQDEEVIHKWSVFACIDGEFELDGGMYLINAGDFYEVAANYLAEINDYIHTLEENDKELPDSIGDMNEGPYNELAANSSENYLLLDKRTVRLSSGTSSIEICDILTDDGCFIHVKRKLSSSDLSHLFSQGYVSGDLFLMSREYREAMRLEIIAAEEDRAVQENDNDFRGKFSTFPLQGISPTDYEVVYAIVAKWDGRDLVDALPFFSKVNLRRFVDDLHRMGYKVSYKRVIVP